MTDKHGTGQCEQNSNTKAPELLSVGKVSLPPTYMIHTATRCTEPSSRVMLLFLLMCKCKTAQSPVHMARIIMAL